MRRVAILWLNYNSMSFIHVVLSSLRSLADLDYSNYVVYVIDNGSTDGSFEQINKFIESCTTLRKVCKVVRLSSNLGFDGAIDVVWQTYVLRGDYDYVVLMNNDVVALPDSLRKMVEIADTMPRLCGLQGAVEFGQSGTLDNMGMYIDSLLHVIPFLRGRRVTELPNCCLYVSYVGGAYALYRVDALKKIQLSNGDLFPRQAFGYWDDDLLGIRAWSSGFCMVAIPYLTCRHMESLTFRKLGLREYLSTRNYLTKILITKTRYKAVLLTIALKYAIRRYLKAKFRGSKLPPSTYIRVLVDGVHLYRKVKMTYGITVDLSRVPIVDYGLRDTIKYAFVYRARQRRIRNLENKILKIYGFRCI